MKKLYLFHGFKILSLTAHQVFAQPQFPRTFSGTKDAIPSGVVDNNGNLYVTGSNGSGLTGQVYSVEELSLMEDKGGFVAKLDANGNTLWYETVHNEFAAWGKKIVLHGDYVYAFNYKEIHQIKTDGTPTNVYQLGNEEIEDDIILDFEVVDDGEGNTYMYVLSRDYNDLYIKILDVFNNFNLVGLEVIFPDYYNQISIGDVKLQVLNSDELYIVANYERLGSINVELYCYSFPYALAVGVERYFLFKFEVDLFDPNFPITYVN